MRQGDNMAPVLFLFLMSAFAKTLETVWKEEGIEVVTVQTVEEQDFLDGKGAIKSHTIEEYTSGSLTAFEILQCLYVDDGAFVFSTRNEMKKGLDLIFTHFARFGLEMHIGRGRTKSKTECVFFPPPRFFASSDSELALPTREREEWTEENAGAITETERKKREAEKARLERENKLYDELDETRDIEVADGFVSFTRHFKYLGSYISYNLRDDFDVDARIASATQSMGALKNVWDNPHMDLYSKYLLFCAIPMNLLLWGCETWSLRQVLLDKLEVFLHRNVRRILGISITQVKEEKIRNERVRTKFYEIPRVRNMIAARQMDFFGKLVQGPWERPAKRMITACCSNKRLQGRPHFHNKDALVKNLKLLFSQVNEVYIDDCGTVKNWIKEASHKEYWNQLVACLLDPTQEIPKYPAKFPRPRRSPRNHESTNGNNHRRGNFDSSPPPGGRDSNNAPPSPPRRRRVPPPRREQQQRRENQNRDYIPENVGNVLYDSLKILGLGLGASESEVKVKYRQLSRIYHPDKHDSEKTGISDNEASEFFKLINNAQAHLREVL